jgi:hypothetical protein
MTLRAAIVSLALVWSVPCAAQAPVHLVFHAEGGASELWARRVTRRLDDEGLETHADATWARERGADLSEAHAALVRVESALAAARDAMRAFDEHRALRALAAAQADVTIALALPGTVAWAAEVELAIGRVAAHAGLASLARDSFARAFALVPTRALGAAEAPPDVVALADEVMTEVRAQPTSRFDIDVGIASATIYLDDQLLGAAPRHVEARAGAHVLRVEADGSEPYVARIDLLPGARPSMSVALAPTRLVGALDALGRGIEGGDVASAIDVLDAALGRPVVAWYVEAGDGPLDRALATPCDRSGCHAPARLEPETLASPLGALDAAAIDPRARRVAIAWRDEPLPIEAPPPPPTDVWSEAWPWALVGTGAALVIGGVIAGIVLATEPPPDHVRQIDPMNGLMH